MGGRSIWEISVPIPYLWCEPKTALKNKVKKKKKQMRVKWRCLIDIITSITPEEFQKTGCNFRLMDEWVSKMAFILVIKIPEWTRRQPQSESSLYVIVILTISKNKEH